MGAHAENQTARTHGVYSVRAHGSSALPEALREREAEAVANLGTRDGIMQELERQAMHQILIVETGMLWLHKVWAAGANPMATGKDGKVLPVLRVLGSYQNGLVRTLAKLAELRDEKGMVDMALGMSEVSKGDVGGSSDS